MKIIWALHVSFKKNFTHMKKIFILLFTLAAVYSNAQVPTHLKWTISSKTLSETEAEIYLKATLDPHWHIYSFNPGDEMLMPPVISFENNKNVKLVGKPTEKGHKISKKEEGFDNPINFFEHSVVYTQKVTFTKPTDLKGTFEYQICDEKGCLPPRTDDLTVKIAKFERKAVDTADIVVEPTATPDVTATETQVDSTLPSDTSVEPTKEYDSYGIFGKPIKDCTKKEGELTMWQAFLAGILGGLAALFFPCTFPMIPMTMSFFLKGSAENKKKGTRNAILYGFAIFLVYFLLSLPFLFLGWSSQSLNAFSTNVWVNLAFFVVFIFFAFSLFGYYDISLPTSLTNKIDSKSDVGSFVGIFFMALTLAIVSFSCTGPILGLVLGNVKNAKLITPAFSGFGLGLGIPFALFALFPNLLKNLPKSGSWLDVVKVVFGFIELAFAFKFLSNADLVMQWGFLKRELFVGIWILISILTGLYLLGIFKFKKGSTFKKTPATYILSVVFLLFAGYLTTDFFKGDLQMISGFPPPKSYSFFKQPEKFDIIRNDFDLAIEKAKKENKPLFVDFTGHACINCRKMEENIWVLPEVYDIMKNKYVIVSLFVDEGTELPLAEQRYSDVTKKQIKTVGDKWFEFEHANFHEASQPVYVLIDPNKKQILNKPYSEGFNSDKTKFLEFLNCGLEGMKK